LERYQNLRKREENQKKIKIKQMMIFNKIHYPSSLCVSTNQVMSSSEKNQERRGNYKKNYKKNYKN